MTESAIDAVPARGRRLPRSLAASGRVIGAAVREGRLRLKGMTRSERWLAMVGVVTFVALMESLLVGGLWRRGPMLDVNPGMGEPRLLPVAVLPLTLVALGVGWMLLCWGAARATLLPRLVTGVVFLLANARLGNPGVFMAQGFGMESLSRIAEILRVVHLAVPLLLLVPSVLPRSVRARTSTLAVLRAGLLLTVGAFFGGLLLVYAGEREAAAFSTLPERLHSSLLETQILSRPVEILGGLGVVVFAWVIARASAAGVEHAPRAPLRAILAVAVVLKVLLAASTLPFRPAAIPVAVAGAGLLIASLLLARRPGDGRGRFEERLLYGGALVLAIPALASLLTHMLGTLIEIQSESAAGGWLHDLIPLQWVNRYGDFAMGVVILGIAAVWAVAGGASGRRGFALPSIVMAGAWIVLVESADAFGANVVFNAPAIDAVTTLGLAAILVARWKRLGRGESAYLLVFAVFTTLMLHQVDVVDPVAALLGLAPTVTLVLSLGWVVVGDSGFTALHGPRLPRGTRALLWIGYLVVAAAILNWDVLSLSFDPASGFLGATGYQLLGIPLAASLLLAEPLHGLLGPRRAPRGD